MTNEEIKCACALWESLKEKQGKYVAVRCDSPVNWSLSVPRSQEAIEASLEPDEPYEVRKCETCGRTFEISPPPAGPWPNCMAPDCPSYDPSCDLDGGGPEWSDNKNVRDDECFPIDITMGELRKGRAALEASRTTTPVDAGRLSFAWTEAGGNYPPYVNLTGNRLTVRERAREGAIGDQHFVEAGRMVFVDLPNEAIAELLAALEAIGGQND